eukprot:483729-Prymnesium_polylepis.2
MSDPPAPQMVATTRYTNEDCPRPPCGVDCTQYPLIRRRSRFTPRPSIEIVVTRRPRAHHASTAPQHNRTVPVTLHTTSTHATHFFDLRLASMSGASAYGRSCSLSPSSLVAVPRRHSDGKRMTGRP